MWKIWLASGVAVSASFITVFMGIINDIRYSVILYRALFALIFGGSIALLAGFAYEKFLLTYLLKKVATDHIVNDTATTAAESALDADGTSTEVPNAIDHTEKEETKSKEFAPFTAKNLNRVSAPKS